MNGEVLIKFKGDSTDVNKSIDSIKQNTSKIGSAMKTAFKVATVAVTATTAAIGKLVSESTKSYAEYEQLVGGVETLFKTDADKLQDFANQAYKTAGLSANEYMSMATSFSASLLQSLKGDTSKAVDYANRAIKDMSDNANKMGTDISMIQSAYQGFAKQNYTMLDNLKLGYGGTKTEMERLITDASKLTDVQKKLGVTIDANDLSFGNIVNAISVMQEKMGIAGTTATEANDTISGSLNSVKSSWKNLLVSFSGGGVDVETAFDNLLKSAKTFAKNLFPVLKKALNSIIKFLPEIADAIIKELPGLIKELFPKILEVMKQLGDSIISILPPSIAEPLRNILGQIMPFIENLAQTILPFIGNILNQILPALARIVEAILPILIQLIEKILPPLMEIINKILPMIVSLIDMLLPLLQPLLDCIMPIIDALFQIITPLVDILNQILPPIIDLLTTLLSAILPVLSGVIKTLMDVIVNSIQWMIGIVRPIIDGFIDKIKSITGVLKGIIDFIKNVFTGNWKGAWEAVKNIFKNIAEAIGNIFKMPINFIIGALNTFIRGLNKIQIPDWVPVVGGKGINIPEIPKLNVGTNFVPEDTLAMIHEGEAVIPKKFNPYANGMSATTLGTMMNGGNTPIINVYADFEMDPIGQVVSNIKTYSGGAKNDYNYGTGV